MIKYVIFGTSGHPKATVCVDKLHKDGFVTKDNCIVMTNGNQGIFYQKAQQLGYTTYIANSDIETYEILKDIDFDYLISCGWHLKFSKKVIELPKKLALNSHSSYLPDYKGAAAYKHAWANGEIYSGSTLHVIDENFDTGKIVAQKKVRIYFWDTPQTLLKRIAKVTPDMIRNIILSERTEGIDVGDNNTKGRYFLKTSNKIFIKYRLHNLFLRPLGFGRKMTRYK